MLLSVVTPDMSGRNRTQVLAAARPISRVRDRIPTVERLTLISLGYPVRTLAACVVATGILAAQIPLLRSETGLRTYIGYDHPSILAADEFIDGFGGGLPILAAWTCETTDFCDTVFDPPALEMAGAIAQALRVLPGVVAVDSPATSPVFVVDEEHIGPRWLLEGGRVSESTPKLARLAAEDPVWVGSIVSTEGDSGALAIELASTDGHYGPGVLAAFEEAAEPYESLGVQFHLVGQPVQLVIGDRELAADSARLVPITMAIIAAIVWALFRSWQVTAVALTTIGMTVAATVGLSSLLGWPRTAFTEALSPLLLAIGLCDAVHLIGAYESNRATGAPASNRAARRAALLTAAGEVSRPCIVTTATTMAGFAAFASSGLQSLTQFGLIASFGVGVALLLTFSVAPILLVVLPAPEVRGDASSRWSGAFDRLATLVRRRSRLVIAGAVLAGIVCAGGATALRIDASEASLQGEDSQIGRAIQFVASHLRPPDALEIEVRLREGTPAHRPDVVARVVRLTHDLPREPGLQRARSFLDLLSATGRTFGPDWTPSGATTAELAEAITILQLYDPATSERWVSADLSRIRLSVDAEKQSRFTIEALLARVRVLLEDAFPSAEFTLTGPLVLYKDMAAVVQTTQLRSFAIAAIVVLSIFAAFLRTTGLRVYASLGWAAIGMIPTLLPVLVTLGAMGLLDIPLDQGTAMVAAVIIGVTVDDSVHLLGAYFRSRSEGSAEPVAAAMRRVGQPIVTTSLALSMGFFTLLLSSWQSVAAFGFLSALTILAALVAVLVVLPAVIGVVVSLEESR